MAESNVPAETLKWSLTAICREFGTMNVTLKQRLAAAGEGPSSDGCYSTAQVTRSLFGSLYQEKLAQSKCIGPKTRLAADLLEGLVVAKEPLKSALADVARSVISIVESSRLSRSEKHDIRLELASIPVAVTDAVRVSQRIFSIPHRLKRWFADTRKRVT